VPIFQFPIPIVSGLLSNTQIYILLITQPAQYTIFIKLVDTEDYKHTFKLFLYSSKLEMIFLLSRLQTFMYTIQHYHHNTDHIKCSN